MSTVAGRSWRGLVGLLTAEGVSILGSRMSMLAIPWFVLVTTGSAARTGVFAFAEMAPYVLVQGLGGPLVDRVGAWRLSVATDLAAAVAVGLVPLLHLTVGLSFAPLCALVAVAGAVRGAGDTSRYVMVPGVTERAGAPMERGAGLSDGVNRLAGMVGAPLAGVLVAFWSAPAVLVVDAATFVVSALLVVTLVPRTAAPGRGSSSGPAAEPSVRGYLHGLGEGFRHLAGDRLLLGIATLVLVTNLVDQAVASVLAPVWAQDVTGSPVTLGLLFGALGAGAVLGNVVFTWLAPRLSRRRTFAWCFLVAGAPRLLAMAAFATPVPVVALSFLAGVGAGGINPILGAVEYERVPRHLQARVLGAVGALAFAGIPVGALAGGLGVTHLGLRPALVVAGLVYLLATLAPFVLPVWRQMERAPAPSAVPSSEPAQPSETVVR
ncbi:MAG: MFS transporter [Actinobacteria bacterium]|nr:MFS transporter [Actinomycetota bacterium]